MIAWVVAGVLLVAVFGFEFLMFRYIRGKSTSTAGRGDRPSGGASQVGDGGPGGTTDGGPSGTPAAGDICQCQQCGAHNDPASPVRYCWHCLSRLP